MHYDDVVFDGNKRSGRHHNKTVPASKDDDYINENTYCGMEDIEFGNDVADVFNGKQRHPLTMSFVPFGADLPDDVA